MAKFEKLYVRKLKNELGWYPNFPTNNPISLGAIGFYYGRKEHFEWRETLGGLGIDISPNPPGNSANTISGSMESVNYNFDVAPSEEYSIAKFNFLKKYSFAYQEYNGTIHSLPINALEQELNDLIKRDAIKWEPDWVIITKLWVNAGFNLLISTMQRSSAEISTSKLVPHPSFNIADFNLGIRVSRNPATVHSEILDKGGNPFFDIHKLIYDKKRRRHFLKLYGRREPWGRSFF